MAGQHPRPSNSNHPPFTPPSYALATPDSDNESELPFPTPLSSPGGPQYDDLPPSYDQAHHHSTLDPNQLEAHRLTLNEGPNEPEVWEYRLRGEEPNAENEQEQAPDYERHASNPSRNVPVQHVPDSHNISVGRVGERGNAATRGIDSTTTLLERALKFTSVEPRVERRSVPRLERCVAIPQEGIPGWPREKSPIKFLRVYAKSLHSHDIQPAEFVEFLDGLNALCEASGASGDSLLLESPQEDNGASLVHDYIRGGNEGFFAARGLKISFRSLSTLLTTLHIPVEEGQRSNAVACVSDETKIAIQRAQSLYPWIEALDTDIPAQSLHARMLREMSKRLTGQNFTHTHPLATNAGSVSGSSHKTSSHNKGRRRGHRGPKGRGARVKEPEPVLHEKVPQYSDEKNMADLGTDVHCGKREGTFSNDHIHKGKGKAKEMDQDDSDTSSISSESSYSSDTDTDSDFDSDGYQDKDKVAKRAIKCEFRQKKRELKKQHRARSRELRSVEKKTRKGKEKEKKEDKLNKTKELKEEKKVYKDEKKQLKKERKIARRDWKNRRDGKVDQGEPMGNMVWLVIESFDF